MPDNSGGEILTVTQLNHAVARLLERNFALAWVSGELSNVTRAASGHWYFTLKDANAQVRAVMFRGRAQYVDFHPREGDRVEVRATVGLYAARGDFQLNVEVMRKAGIGNLYEAFLKLKAKLESEGLFDPNRKRSLPEFPRIIGVVTSPQAAALRDLISAFRRRAPHVQLIVYPTLVQGAGSAEQIAHAINTASARAECDLLIVARGGGSLEDLWAFNEEAVARAIFESAVPVVSAVGHEIDFTIADFVADLRAATPSAAAELITEGAFASREFVVDAAARLNQLARQQLDAAEEAFAALHHRLTLAHPRRRLQENAQRLDDAGLALTRETKTQLRERRHRLDQAAGHLQRIKPTAQLALRREQLAALTSRLRLLSPENVLARGYSITTDAATGQVIRRAAQVKAGQKLRTRVSEGEFESVIPPGRNAGQ